MINLEHELTVDDLIVEYMMYKVNNGYEVQFLTSEFISFLYYFESKMPVKDCLYDNIELFKRFLARKAENDWARIINWKTNEKEIKPHMDMIYSPEEDDYIIKANYLLSYYDESTINTYFMDNGLSKFNHFKGKRAKIREIIGNYLQDQPKRKIVENIDISDYSLIVGKTLSAEIINIIWNSYLKNQIKNHRWPEQCRDINKYLFNIDLAEVIGLKSIRKELLNLYEDISKRIAILYQQDKNLKISNRSGSYLAMANYNLLIEGYQEMFALAFGEYKSSLEIDLASKTFKESHEIDGIYMEDEDPDVSTTTLLVGNDKAKKLVRTIDEYRKK